MAWNGKCGKHCPWWVAWHRQDSGKLGEINGCSYLVVIKKEESCCSVYNGNSCSVPPTGPWNWNMDEALRDGTVLRLLVLDADGTHYRQCDGYHDAHDWIQEPSHLGIRGEYRSVIKPVAFAIINKPWEENNEI